MIRGNPLSPAAAAAQSTLWEGIARLIDTAPSLDALYAHRIELLAANRWQELGRSLPMELVDRQYAASALTITAPVLLERVRDACEGTIVVLKGPEVAAHYPDAALRPYGDVDILVADPERAQEALLDAGFVTDDAGSSPRARFHLHPLVWPGLPLQVEVHSRPNWPRRLSAPAGNAFLRRTIPSATGIEGVSTLPVAMHAVVVAVHGWTHAPLAYARDLVDVAVMTAGADPEECEAAARELGVLPIWRTTLGAIESALLGARRRTMPERLWARNLAGVRERTVFESHIEDWLSWFWALPPRAAARAMAGEISSQIKPGPGESWPARAERMRIAARHAFLQKSEHDRRLHDRSRAADADDR